MNKAPKWLRELMKRSKYSGEYTIDIYKSTPYTYVSTLQKEVNRLCIYVESDMDRRIKNCGGDPMEDREPTIIIRQVPKRTHYCKQYATVTIYDPVMMDLEKLMEKER